MIRFCNSKVYCVEYSSLNKKDLYDYFMNGHQKDIVCVLSKATYIGYITYTSLQESEDLHDSIQGEYLILDETIWQKGREYFSRYKMLEVLPVLNREHQLVCLAWQDEEANRELRMLRELEECREALSFRDLYPDYTGVMIYGCNELAWYMMKYLIKIGIVVNVDGELWEELGTWEKYAVPTLQNYDIWAEGVHQKSGDWRQERLRSASVEFECVDKIYEANIKAGKITDADGNVEDLLERLRKEKQVVIRGTGTKAQDAYDWLFSQGIDICAFQSGKVSETRKSLFGKPILPQTEITERFKSAVIIECGSKHSAWGFKDVDMYDYEGCERNRRYLLLRDYIEVPENNLTHVLTGHNLIFVGDIRLCNRAYKWWKRHGKKIGEMGYWDILEENRSEIGKFEIPEINGEKMAESDVYMLVMPKYAYDAYIKKVSRGCSDYIERLNTYGIYEYIDYFSDMRKSIYLEDKILKYNKKTLCPLGILLGAIPGYCGNALIRQSLSDHPQIMMIGENGFFNDNLYSFSIRLAEEKSENVLSIFRMMFQREVGADEILNYFPNMEIFNHKMEELLSLSDSFTSQELFVMFHIAYEAMYEREILDLDNMIIYWEPHSWNRELVRDFAFWLGSKEVKGFTLSTVRNRYIFMGSAMKREATLSSKMNVFMYGCYHIKRKAYEFWKEYTIKFEELKCSPQETLTAFCQWLGISFNNVLLETTWHGKMAFFDGITGFDVKPAYNLYEESFTSFDRMRICMMTASFQKQYGYPYVNVLDFSRREQQEMFLKEFRFEKLSEAVDEESLYKTRRRIGYLLWQERFAEIMKVAIDEEF